MADLKPLGSEKLNGDEKLKRILELTYYQNNKNKTSNKTTELVSEAKTGGIYGIVKEKDSYYVKRGLNESSLDYIGGMFMKNKNRFSSYAEALKRLELLKGQEELQEATKYVLKQKPSASESPVSEPPIDDLPPADEALPEPDMSNSDDSSLELPEPELDGEEMSSDSDGKRSDYMAEVQKFAGKLGQELRDQKEKMESDDIKYVLNMIISAVDLEKLEDEDIEEIGKKFDRDEVESEEEPISEPEMDNEEIPSDEVPVEDDLSEMDAMDSLESFINTPMDTEEEIDLSKYADLGEESNEESDEDYLKEIDLDEIKDEINKSIGDALSKYFN
jgi:hypothetical protein